MNSTFCWFLFLSVVAVSLAENSASGEGSGEVLICDPPCAELRTCNMTKNGLQCVLVPGGRQALIDGSSEEVKDVCSPNPCAGDCECVPSCKHELGYQCISQEGYIGKNCDIGIPVINCTESSIVIEISDLFYKEFDQGIENSEIYMSPDVDSKDKCKAVVTSSGAFQIEVQLPFTDCGTFISDLADLVSQGIPFANKLWINRNTDGSAFDMPVPIFNFTCIYARDYSIVTALEPIIQQDPVQIGRTGKFTVEFDLCKKDVYPEQCPLFLTVKDYGMYTIGQMIHVNVKVLTGQVKPDFATTLERMFLSCSEDPFNTAAIFSTLAAAGCASEEQLFKFAMKAGIAANPQSVSASCQVPRASNCEVIFIHVKVLLCLTDQLSSCADGSSFFCQSEASRKKRSLGNENSAYAVLGPITIINGSIGRSIEEIFIDGVVENGYTFRDDVVIASAVNPKDPKAPNKEPVKTSTSNENLWFLLIGAIALAISCVTVTSFVLHRLYRSSLRRSHDIVLDATDKI